jgi:RNA polymerase sigma-70 factor (ECF subfamily)
VYEDDLSLVSRMQNGDQRAFTEFFEGHVQRLAAFAARRTGIDAAGIDDIVQNTLIKAVRNLAGYRGEAALSTWLAGICRHEIADTYRSAARRPGLRSLDSEADAHRAVLQLRIPAHREPVAEVDAESTRQSVMQALDELPEHYARALEAKYGDGLSVEEVARLLGLTPVATQSLLARAREAFRERWRAADVETRRGERQA